MYLTRETEGKARTTGEDIAPGAIELRHLSPGLFLELQLIKLHRHLGAESQVLDSGATPESVRGYTPTERVEHDVATWTGGASASGSVALTFGTAFTGIPDVIAIASGRASSDIKITTSTPTTTGVTLYWKLDSGTATSVDICYFVIGS